MIAIVDGGATKCDWLILEADTGQQRERNHKNPDHRL